MRAVVLKKYVYNESAFVERQLPSDGKIVVSVGAKVRSFDKLGECIYSERSQDFSYEGELVKSEGELVYSDDVIWAKKKGPFGSVVGRAPFSGVIVDVDDEKKTYKLERKPRDFTLISGVPGVVEDIVAGKSVLVKTKALEISGVGGKGSDSSGEIVVIGSYGSEPADFSELGDLSGKIIACGVLSPYLYSKAKLFGVSGFIAGSVSYSLYKDLDVRGDVPVVVLEGFGQIPMNPFVFDYLKGIASRFVVINPGSGKAIIYETRPLAWVDNSAEIYADVLEGQVVQVFAHEAFGLFGTVLGAEKGRVKVDVWDLKKTVPFLPGCVGIVLSRGTLPAPL